MGRLRFVLLTLVGAAASLWLTSPSSPARTADDRVTRPVQQSPAPSAQVDRAPHADARRGLTLERWQLRQALERRGELEARVKDLRTIAVLIESDHGAKLPPTVANCTHVVGHPKCPLASEWPELLRYMADCHTLAYDMPSHIFQASTPGVLPPWAELELDAEQRGALAQADRHLSQLLADTMRDAYHDTFGTDPPAGLDLGDALRELRRSEAGRNADWGTRNAPLARLGELSESEIEALPPLARLSVRVGMAGDLYEESLAAVLGREPAHSLRLQDRGWKSKGVGGGGIKHETPAKCGQVDPPEGWE